MIPGIALFVFKDKVNKNGEVKIYIRFTSNRRSSYVCTNILIPVKFWDNKRQRVKSSFGQANAINMLLERKMSEMRGQLMIKAMGVRHITSKQAKSLGVKKGDLSFFALADSYVDQLNCLSPLNDWTDFLIQFRTLNLGNHEYKTSKLEC